MNIQLTKLTVKYFIIISISLFLINGCKKNSITSPVQNNSGYLLYVGTYSSNKVFIIDPDK